MRYQLDVTVNFNDGTNQEYDDGVHSHKRIGRCVESWLDWLSNSATSFVFVVTPRPKPNRSGSKSPSDEAIEDAANEHGSVRADLTQRQNHRRQTKDDHK